MLICRPLYIKGKITVIKNIPNKLDALEQYNQASLTCFGRFLTNYTGTFNSSNSSAVAYGL